MDAMFFLGFGLMTFGNKDRGQWKRKTEQGDIEGLELRGNVEKEDGVWYVRLRIECD
jgi:hypothetical protein